jgi:hypothetical protein
MIRIFENIICRTTSFRKYRDIGCVRHVKSISIFLTGCEMKCVNKCEISSSHGGEYEVDLFSGMYCCVK